jgi:hypothetical protein
MKKPKDTTTNAAPVATPASAPVSVKKVSLAGFTTQTPATKSAKADPLLPDPDGQVGELISSILDKSVQVEALQGALELEKAELIAVAKPFYFTHHNGQHAVASSLEARSADGKVVRVGFSNSYRGTSDEPAITRIAGEHAARFFKQSFELKIKGDAIPDATVEPLLAELQALFARHGASGGALREGDDQADEGVPHRAAHAIQRRAELRTRQSCADHRERENEARTGRKRR